ncbi:MAG: hypothetical protein ACFCUE_03520 [Candidatus Bathyarchaeia archaeon]
MATGTIQTVYKGLISYPNSLRLHFEKKYPDFYISRSVQPGTDGLLLFLLLPQKTKTAKNQNRFTLCP